MSREPNRVFSNRWCWYPADECDWSVSALVEHDHGRVELMDEHHGKCANLSPAQAEDLGTALLAAAAKAREEHRA